MIFLSRCVYQGSRGRFLLSVYLQLCQQCLWLVTAPNSREQFSPGLTVLPKGYQNLSTQMILVRAPIKGIPDTEKWSASLTCTVLTAAISLSPKSRLGFAGMVVIVASSFTLTPNKTVGIRRFVTLRRLGDYMKPLTVAFERCVDGFDWSELHSTLFGPTKRALDASKPRKQSSLNTGHNLYV